MPLNRPPRSHTDDHGSTDTIVEPSTTSSTSNGSGDHDKFAHIVIGGTDAVVRSMVTGEPVTALCGKTWVPSSNGAGFQMCPACDELKQHINRDHIQDW